jgi:hypothetical protein
VPAPVIDDHSIHEAINKAEAPKVMLESIGVDPIPLAAQVTISMQTEAEPAKPVVKYIESTFMQTDMVAEIQEPKQLIVSPVFKKEEPQIVVEYHSEKQIYHSEPSVELSSDFSSSSPSGLTPEKPSSNSATGISAVPLYNADVTHD